MAQIVTQYANPDIEAYRLGLLSDTQGLVRNQQLGRQVQGLRGQLQGQTNPDTEEEYTADEINAYIAKQLSTNPTPDLKPGDEGYIEPTNYDPEYISSISQDAQFGPSDFQVAGLTGNQTDAIDMAARGVGSYKPYLQSGRSTLNQGIGAVNAGRNLANQGTALGGMFAQEGMNDLQTAGIRSQIAGREYAGGMLEQATAAQGRMNQIGDSAQNVADDARFGGQQVLGRQGYGLAQAEGMMNQAVGQGQQGLDTGSARARAGTGIATDALYGAGQAATGIAGDTTDRARALNAPLERRLGSSTQGGLGEATKGQLGADEAAYLARQSTAAAQGQLGEAADFGLGTAKSGIAQLRGASTQFDPSGIGAYNNPYQDEVMQATLADLERVAARRERDAQEAATKQAVSLGAFGSSGYERALDRSVDPIREELDRNTAATIGQLRSQGYESSANRALQAFENARNRQIQTAQATGQLGQSGAGTSASAAQAGGQLGLGAETLAQGSALQGAALGLDARKFESANAQAIAATGLSIEQLAAQTGLNAQQIAGNFARDAGQLNLSTEQLASQNAEAGAKLGMTGAQFKAANETALAQTGMNVEQLAASTGMQAKQLAGQLAQQAGQLGVSAQQGAGNLRLAAENQGINAASNYANLGLDYGRMNQAGGVASGNLGAQLGTMGIQQAGIGELEQSLRRNDVSDLLTTGGIKQTNDQAVLDAIKMTNDQNYQLPFQETGFLGDIYAGVPTSQSTVTSGTTSNASPFMQAASLGIAGLSAAAGVKSGGLFS